MSREEIPIPEPVYSADLHSDVVGECKEYWLKARPWTKLRVLRKGVDASSGAICTLCQGEVGTCDKEVEAVQYNTTFGDAQWYCEDHALKQSEWDVIHYDSKPKPTPPLTPEQEKFIAKLLEKKKTKKERDEEREEKEREEYNP